MFRKFFSLIFCSVFLFTSFSPILAAEPTVVADDSSWLSSLVSPSAYFHVRDIDLTDITAEEYINRYRQIMGLPGLEINEALRQSAQNHVDYQAINGVYNGDAHAEDSSLSGFTGATTYERCRYAGYTGDGCAEVQAWGTQDLFSAIDGFMMTPFHRIGIIYPYVNEVGCAENGDWITCDFGLEYTLPSGLPEFMVYPADGQVISTTFQVNESPMPYPKYAGKKIGPTIMVWPATSSASLEAEVSLYDLTDQKFIDSIISIDTDRPETYGAIFFNPVEPLELNHEYAARVVGTTKFDSWEKSWTFKTQKSSNIDFPDIEETITYDAHTAWVDPDGAEQIISVPNNDLSATIDRLSGYIMLVVDYHGEAWYVDPVSRYRYYLKDGPTAFEFLRSFGLGITNADLAQIPAAEEAVGGGELAERLSGRILLQVEEHGEAWYINPSDLKRYYLKDGDEAYRIMRELSLGTLLSSIEGITIGTVE